MQASCRATCAEGGGREQERHAASRGGMVTEGGGTRLRAPASGSPCPSCRSVRPTPAAPSRIPASPRQRQRAEPPRRPQRPPPGARPPAEPRRGAFSGRPRSPSSPRRTPGPGCCPQDRRTPVRREGARDARYTEPRMTPSPWRSLRLVPLAHASPEYLMALSAQGQQLQNTAWPKVHSHAKTRDVERAWGHNISTEQQVLQARPAALCVACRT